jgi:hypothetical protein
LNAHPILGAASYFSSTQNMAANAGVFVRHSLNHELQGPDSNNTKLGSPTVKESVAAMTSRCNQNRQIPAPLSDSRTISR